MTIDKRFKVFFYTTKEDKADLEHFAEVHDIPQTHVMRLLLHKGLAAFYELCGQGRCFFPESCEERHLKECEHSTQQSQRSS